MPVRPTYPGVYIEEIPSGVRTIVGVSTSVTAFVGYFTKGAMDKAVQIFSWGDFEREYGGLQRDSEASYAIRQFFTNGGSEAWVVRTAKDAEKAAVAMLDSASSGTAVLEVEAKNEGSWGNYVRLDIDYDTATPTSTFNLTVSELDRTTSRPIRSETFRNLSMDKNDPNYVVDVVNAASKLVKISLSGTPTSTPKRPTPTGTTSKDLAGLDLTLVKKDDKLKVKLNGAVAGTITLGEAPTSFEGLRSRLQAKIRTLTKVSKATVEWMGSRSTSLYLCVKAGTGNPSDVLTFEEKLATTLTLKQAATTNVQLYAPGGAAKAAQALPTGATGQQEGDDGKLPTATELIGVKSSKTGIYALEDVDLFNILCIPYTMKLDDSSAQTVITDAESYCQERRAFYIVDFPSKVEKSRDEPSEIKDWLDVNATLRHRNAALYYPRVKIPDPLNKYRPRTVGASGTLAGLYARTDSERGVWKAPAGTDAALRNVQALEYNLTDPENGTLNPLAINCLRNFPVYGHVCWGARTLKGADQIADEYKYVPIRRLVLYLEESLYRGTKWVVFEPNDEPLWAQIRLNVGAFMHDLFRQGAFQGTTPREAYFVKCDSETTTQSDINKGIVNILVGFAPLKPAEFVIIKIQQIAGEIQT
jgi:phage tail sheath protein FI